MRRVRAEGGLLSELDDAVRKRLAADILAALNECSALLDNGRDDLAADEVARHLIAKGWA